MYISQLLAKLFDVKFIGSVPYHGARNNKPYTNPKKFTTTDEVLKVLFEDIIIGRGDVRVIELLTKMWPANWLSRADPLSEVLN